MYKKVIAIAENEVGYLEKKSNSDLDSKTGNAGSGNYTKYARDLDSIGFYNGKKNGYPWCDVFVDWCFVQAFGDKKAKELLCQPDKSLGAGCGYSMGYYKNRGQLYDTPQVGDQIFFLDSSGDVGHTGIVVAVDAKKVYTVEGNTSKASGVVANGGGVAKKSYNLTYSKIAGYGRPKYTTEASTETPKAEPKAEEYTLKQFIKDVQSVTGSKVDGIAGSETISNTITVSAYKNNRHAVVKYIQKRLNTLGFDCGEVDGIAGPLFTKAVKEYQKKYGRIVDGEITARNITWKKLLGMA